MRKWDVGNGLDFRYFKDSKIGLPSMESIQRIMIGAEGTLSVDRSSEHPAPATPSMMPRGAPDPTMRRVNWSITTRTQCVVKVADAHRNKSQLHKLSFVWPRKVSQDGPPVFSRIQAHMVIRHAQVSNTDWP